MAATQPYSSSARRCAQDCEESDWTAAALFTFRLQPDLDQAADSVFSPELSCSRLIFLVHSTGDDLERVIRQRSLQRLGFIPRRSHPDVALLVGRQDYRHCLRMNCLTTRVRGGRQEV